jgi:hypothetical protein
VPKAARGSLRNGYMGSPPLEPCGSLWVLWPSLNSWRVAMNGLIYLIGLIVVILAILSFFGLR